MAPERDEAVEQMLAQLDGYGFEAVCGACQRSSRCAWTAGYVSPTGKRVAAVSILECPCGHVLTSYIGDTRLIHRLRDHLQTGGVATLVVERSTIAGTIGDILRNRAH